MSNKKRIRKKIKSKSAEIEVLKIALKKLQPVMAFKDVEIAMLQRTVALLRAYRPRTEFPSGKFEGNVKVDIGMEEIMSNLNDIKFYDGIRQLDKSVKRFNLVNLDDHIADATSYFMRNLKTPYPAT